MTTRSGQRQFCYNCGFAFGILFGIGTVFGPLASAQPLQDWQVCSGKGNPSFDQRAKACAAIIESQSEAPISRAQSYGYRGVAYQNNQNADAAIREYDLSLALDSTSASGHRFSGLRHVLKKEYDLALAEFDEAIRLDPTDAMAHNGRGLIHLARKEADKALADFSEAIRLNPAYAPFLGNLALAYREHGDHSRAIAEYDRVIELDPTYFMAFYGRGATYIANKQFDRAIADFSKAIELRPDYSASFIARASIYRAQGDMARALADYDEAIRLDPKNIGAFINRASTKFARGDYDRAIADYDEAIRFAPKQAAIIDSRGMAYSEKGDIPRAIVDYDRAIEIDPSFALAYSHRCLGRTKLGLDFETALADCDKALRLKPGEPKTVSIRGFANLKRGSIAAAIADFNAALAINPKDPWSLYGRGLAKWKTKDIAGAEADVAAAAKNRSGMARLVATYYGVTAERDFASRLADARIRETPLIFAMAEGAADACGPGCSAWIVAEGSFDPDAEKRFRGFLRGLKGRKPPIFFNSNGGSMNQAFAIGKLLRANKMTAGVAITVPEGCAVGSPACRQLIQASAPLKAKLQPERAICHSACVYAFMGGSVRQLPAGTSVGVHSTVRSSLAESRSGRTREQLDAHLHSLRRQYAQHMGVSPELVDLADNTPFEQLHILSRDEIALFRMEATQR